MSKYLHVGDGFNFIGKTSRGLLVSNCFTQLRVFYSSYEWRFKKKPHFGTTGMTGVAMRIIHRRYVVTNQNGNRRSIIRASNAYQVQVVEYKKYK